MDYETIRRTALTAMFASDELYDLLVLRGANALLAHGVSRRSSLDLDLALHRRGDCLAPEKLRRLIEASLRDRFDAKGVTAF